MKKVMLFCLCIFACVSCKSPKNNIQFLTDTNDFSNNSNAQDHQKYLSYLSSQKSLKNIKVLYQDKIYAFEDFKTKLFQNQNLQIDIIKDSVAISKHQINNCKVLIVAKDQ